MASIGRVSATLGISLVTTLFALPASHAAKCTSWNIGNQPPGLQWGVRQSNGYIVGFVFRQQGTTLRGTAQYWLVGEGNKRTDGTINGTIKGKVISFAVRWSNGAVGDYFGEVNDDGTIQGRHFRREGENRKLDRSQVAESYLRIGDTASAPPGHQGQKTSLTARRGTQAERARRSRLFLPCEESRAVLVPLHSAANKQHGGDKAWPAQRFAN
jgi:hypothetical protein